MSGIDSLVKDFLAQKKIAVVGVSNQRDTGCNSNYLKFKNAGYQVCAVHPHIHTYDGAKCYPDLKSIPEKPDAVFIFANPTVTDMIVRQCVELGVKHVWMHCMMGTKARLGGEHDQRLERSGGAVQGKWDCGHSGNVSESIFAARSIS
ncbi:MAG: CoA-binding protein [Anaerolineales bacterium]